MAFASLGDFVKAAGEVHELKIVSAGAIIPH